MDVVRTYAVFTSYLLCQIHVTFGSTSLDIMNTNDSMELDETQSLPTCHSSVAVGMLEDNNNSDGAVISSSPRRSSTESNGEGDREHRDTSTACSLIGAQQQNDAITPCQKPSYAAENRPQKLWLWETLSITVAVLSLTAIVITLVIHNDNPLPRWPSQITINSLISVLTSIFKASLMMPIAEGISQMRWLWYLKPRPLGQMEQWDLASRGSFSMLFYIYSSQVTDVLSPRSMGLTSLDPHAQNPRPCRSRCCAHDSRHGRRSFYPASSTALQLPHNR